MKVTSSQDLSLSFLPQFKGLLQLTGCRQCQQGHKLWPDAGWTYAQQTASGAGNGRRILTVPIGDPSWVGNGNGSAVVVGYGNFFLETTYSGTSGPICAIYIGPADLNGTSSGRTDSTKVYFNVLYR